MNRKILHIFSAIAVLALFLSSVSPAAAAFGARMQNVAAARAGSTNGPALDTKGKAGADTQISARITALANLEVRINQMLRVSSSDKVSLDSVIQSSITDMNTLKAKIDSDTDNATLKSDIQSITQSYRIYMLVMPQGRIMAAADRAMSIASMFNDLSSKLQLRIAAVQGAGQNVASLNASLADMNAKSADGFAQAQAAVAEVSGLKPDNGDQNALQSNQAALKDARSKIQAATTDLKSARQDAGSIVKALLAIKTAGQTPVSSPPPTTTNP